jgi:hypothetical protein
MTARWKQCDRMADNTGHREKMEKLFLRYEKYARFGGDRV